MVILTDSVIRKDENYHHVQVLLKECKYIEKGKKVLKYIPNDLIFFSDGSIEFDNKLGIIIVFF